MGTYWKKKWTKIKAERSSQLMLALPIFSFKKKMKSDALFSIQQRRTYEKCYSLIKIGIRIISFSNVKCVTLLVVFFARYVINIA